MVRNTTVFVRAEIGTRCKLADSQGRQEAVDVPADNAGWTAVKGADVKGDTRAETRLTCEQTVSVTTGAARLLSYPFRAGWLALPCLLLSLAAIGYDLRTVYLRWRHGSEINRDL